MAAVLKHWREAATLILATSSNLSRTASFQLTSSSTTEGLDVINNMDVLMLKRSSKSQFMPNMYVFPGGVATNCDFSSKWLSIFSKLGQDTQRMLFNKLSEKSSSAAPLFSRKRDPQFSLIPAEVAFRICAIRETFEESGVLLAVPAEQSRNGLSSLKSDSLHSISASHDHTTISSWRRRVNQNPDEFLNMCLELNLVPVIWSLYEWSNWLTPQRAQQNMRRFDTVFFVCCTDFKPDAVVDKEETVNAIWASPIKLLAAYYDKNDGLPPPQLYELTRLVNFKTAHELLSHVAQPDRVRVERWLSHQVIAADCHIEVLPGDDLYEEQDINVYKESLEELNSKYPLHHRMAIYLGSSGLVAFVYCNIPPKKGHVSPNVQIVNNIRTKLRGRL